MGDELDCLKDDIREIKDGIKDITRNMNNLRVLIAGDYVTKKDFASEIDKNDHAHSNFTNSLICITLTLLTVFGYLVMNGF